VKNSLSLSGKIRILSPPPQTRDEPSIRVASNEHSHANTGDPQVALNISFVRLLKSDFFFSFARIKSSVMLSWQ